MAELDIVIRNGEIVTDAGPSGQADIGIAGGLVVQIGGELEGRQELDATGKLILPGGLHGPARYHTKNESRNLHNFTFLR